MSNLAEPTNEARAETQARLGYALQGGGRAEGSTARMGREAGGCNWQTQPQDKRMGELLQICDLEGGVLQT